MNDLLKLAFSLSLAAGSLLAQDGREAPATPTSTQPIAGEDAQARPHRAPVAAPDPWRRDDAEQRPVQPTRHPHKPMQRPQTPQDPEKPLRDGPVVLDLGMTGGSVHVYTRGGNGALLVLGNWLLEQAVQLPGGGALLVKPDVVVPMLDAYDGRPSVAIPAEVFFALRKAPMFLQAIGLRADGFSTSAPLEI